LFHSYGDAVPGKRATAGLCSISGSSPVPVPAAVDKNGLIESLLLTNKRMTCHSFICQRAVDIFSNMEALNGISSADIECMATS